MFALNRRVSLLERYFLSNRVLRKVHIRTNLLLAFMVFLVFLGGTIGQIIVSIMIFGTLATIFNFRMMNFRGRLFERLSIRESLLMMLETNGLYASVSSGDKKVVQRSATLSFHVNDELIKVSAHIQGDNWSKKLWELDDYLVGALGLELEKKKHEPQLTHYSFLRNKVEVEQYVFSDTTESLNKEFFKGIPVDIVPLTNNQKFSLKSNTNIGLYGRTGTGKTIALQWLLYNAVAKGCATAPHTYLSVVDGKGGDLYALGELLKRELGNNVNVGQTPASLAKLSREFVEIMDSRFEVIQGSKALNTDAYDLKMIPNFLFIDELASIHDSCGSTKNGRELWNEILQNLGLIARKGRQAACHLCISTQDPNAEQIPVELRNQISAVLYLGNPSADRVRMAFAMCELENVPTVSDRKGEALFFSDGNIMTEPEITIVPYVDINTKQDFIEVIKNIRSTHY